MKGSDLVYLARSKARLTQAELGKRAGIAQNSVSRIERGRVDPGFDLVRALVRAAGFDLQTSLATADDSYGRAAKRRLSLSPRERIDANADLIGAAQRVRRAALAAQVDEG